MIFLYTWLLGIVAGFIAVLCSPEGITIAAASETLLFYQLTITVTLSGLIGFIGHVLRSDMVAESIGWEKGSPFQKELGFAELGYAIAGFLCLFFGREFWLAVIVLISPLYLLAGMNHLKELIIWKNKAPNNIWAILPDILLPTTWFLLFLLSK